MTQAAITPWNGWPTNLTSIAADVSEKQDAWEYNDHFISTMVFHMLVRYHLYFNSGPRASAAMALIWYAIWGNKAYSQ